MNIIQNKGELTAAIRSILHTGKALDKAIHQAACSALWHAREYGDTGFVSQLLMAMPSGSRKKGLVYWIEKHSPIHVKALNDGTYKVTAKGWDKPEKWFLQAAINVPFWDFEKEPNVKPALTVEGLIKYLQKLAEEDDAKKVDPKARELAGQLVSLAA